MGTPLRIKRSAVPGKIPAVQDLQLGELALNTYDAELYTLRYRPGIGTEVVKIGGDIKFKEFKNGIVKVQLRGSCSGCPSSTMTLKQGVQNLLCHYIPDVKEVEAI